jgi:hypothetical protein
MSWLGPAVLLALAGPAQAAPAWSPTQHYEVTDVGAGHGALDAAGDAFVVWKGFGELYGVVRRAGAAWPAATPLGDAQTCCGPGLSQLAVSPSGDAAVIWSDDTTGTLTAATSDDAAPWQTAALWRLPGRRLVLSTPQVGIADDGAATALWQLRERSHGALRDVLIAQRPRGGPWSLPTPAPPGTTGPLVVAPDGTVFVFGPGVVAVQPHGAGVFEEEPSPVIGSATTQLVGDASGNLVAVWRDPAAGELHAAYRAAAGGWSATEVLTSDPSAVAFRLAMTRGGQATAAFVDASGVRAAVRLGAAPFGPVQTIATGAATLGSLADDEAGDAVVSFQQGAQELAASAPAGGPFGPPERLPEGAFPPSPYGVPPSVSLDAAGNAYAAWAEERPTHRSRGFAVTATRPAGGAWGSLTIMSRHWQPYHSRWVQPTVIGQPAGVGALALWTAFQIHGPRGVELADTPTP